MAKTTSTDMVKWDEELARRAAAATKVLSEVGSGGNFISFRGGVMSYQGVPVKDNKMACIVVAQKLVNIHYATAFDPDSPGSPDCYAFGDNRKTMAPDPEQVEEPISPVCAGCGMKQFGSAERGKGKACGDLIRLFAIAEPDLDNVADAELAHMMLPFFSTLEWTTYVRNLAGAHNKGFQGFVTRLIEVPDPKSQFRIKFEMIDEVDKNTELRTALRAKIEKAEQEITFPFPKFEREDAVAPAAPAAPARRVTQRKTVVVPAPRKAPVVPIAAAAAGKPVAVGVRRAVKAPKF
jgi:hypothetical protein